MNSELKDIIKIINENYNEFNLAHSNEHYKNVPYDWTVNSRIQNGILNTDQNLIGYDTNYNIPLTLNNNNLSTYNNKNNNSNKNSEITMFTNYPKSQI